MKKQKKIKSTLLKKNGQKVLHQVDKNKDIVITKSGTGQHVSTNKY